MTTAPDPKPIRDRRWTDSAGTRWSIRGGVLSPAAARRLFRRSDVQVLHAYMEARIVEGEELGTLLARLERFFHSDAPDYADFRVADFRDGTGRVLAVIEESC